MLVILSWIKDNLQHRVITKHPNKLKLIMRHRLSLKKKKEMIDLFNNNVNMKFGGFSGGGFWTW